MSDRYVAHRADCGTWYVEDTARGRRYGSDDERAADRMARHMNRAEDWNVESEEAGAKVIRPVQWRQEAEIAEAVRALLAQAFEIAKREIDGGMRPRVLCILGPILMLCPNDVEMVRQEWGQDYLSGLRYEPNEDTPEGVVWERSGDA